MQRIWRTARRREQAPVGRQVTGSDTIVQSMEVQARSQQLRASFLQAHDMGCTCTYVAMQHWQGATLKFSKGLLPCCCS